MAVNNTHFGAEDIARKLSETGKNVVVIDYKNEISATFDDGRLLDVGNSLVLAGAPRLWGLERAIRNLSPEVIVTDEIYSLEEYKILEKSIDSGVKIVASAHFGDVERIPQIFERYIGLKLPIGSSPEVYDKNKQKIPT